MVKGEIKMSFREREILKTIYEQIKILQDEGTEEEVIIFINSVLKTAIQLKCSNSIINRLFVLKDYIELGYKL